MARTINCTVVQVPETDPYLPAPREFNDLVPWADPYITLLLHKLCRRAASEEGLFAGDNRLHDRREELPPPLDKDDRELPWEPDWSQRNWPQR